jgi:uroporphyrinogen decarboxylase
LPESSFAKLSNDRFLKACRREAVDRPPVWLMRQAGRYLPEYRATRAKAGSFMGLATQPELATEVTLQPIDRYGLDAAILFSDILTVPDAMGLGLTFADGEGPRMAHPLRDEAAVMQLQAPDLNKLRYVFDAVTMIRRELRGRVPLIGFSGSPYTLACYMVQGSGSDDWHRVKTMLYSRPDLMQRIVDVNAQAVTAYLQAQIDAGAQAVMVFDSWGGALADGSYQQFSLAPMRRVVDALRATMAKLPDSDARKHVPIIVFTKGGGAWLELLAGVGADVVGLDWTVNLRQARERTGHRVALQGNLDPAVLLASEGAVREQVRRVLDDYGRGPGHIFNLGHGISKDTPPQSVAALVDEVHRHGPTLSAQS